MSPEEFLKKTFVDDYFWDFGNSWHERTPDIFTGYEPPEAMWKLQDGLDLVRKLQSKSWELGYHLNLGGGIINKGYSDKDLDVLAMFQSIREQSPEKDLVNLFIVEEGFILDRCDNKFKGITVYKMKRDLKITPFMTKHQQMDLIVVHAPQTGVPGV